MQDRGLHGHLIPFLHSAAQPRSPDGKGGPSSGNKPHVTHTHNTHRHVHTHTTQTQARAHTHHTGTHTYNTHVRTHPQEPSTSYHPLYGTCPVHRFEEERGRKGGGNGRAARWPSTFSRACLMNLSESIPCFDLTANAKDG